MIHDEEAVRECPTCGSTNIEVLSWQGLAESERQPRPYRCYATVKCNNCGTRLDDQKAETNYFADYELGEGDDEKQLITLAKLQAERKAVRAWNRRWLG